MKQNMKLVVPVEITYILDTVQSSLTKRKKKMFYICLIDQRQHEIGSSMRNKINEVSFLSVIVQRFTSWMGKMMV